MQGVNAIQLKKKKKSRYYLDTKHGVKGTFVCVSLWFGCDSVMDQCANEGLRGCQGYGSSSTSPHPFSKKRWMAWPTAPIWQTTSSKADRWVKQPRWAIYSSSAFHPSSSLAQFSRSFFIPWIIAALPETLFQR